MPAAPQRDRSRHGLHEGDDGVGAGESFKVGRNPIAACHLLAGKDRLALQRNFGDWRRIAGLCQRLEHETHALAGAPVVAAGKHDRRDGSPGVGALHRQVAPEHPVAALGGEEFGPDLARMLVDEWRAVEPPCCGMCIPAASSERLGDQHAPDAAVTALRRERWQRQVGETVVPGSLVRSVPADEALGECRVEPEATRRLVRRMAQPGRNLHRIPGIEGPGFTLLIDEREGMNDPRTALRATAIADLLPDARRNRRGDEALGVPSTAGLHAPRAFPMPLHQFVEGAQDRSGPAEAVKVGDVGLARERGLLHVRQDTSVACHEVDAETEDVEVARFAAEHFRMRPSTLPFRIADRPQEPHGGIAVETMGLQILVGAEFVRLFLRLPASGPGARHRIHVVVGHIEPDGTCLLGGWSDDLRRIALLEPAQRLLLGIGELGAAESEVSRRDKRLEQAVRIGRPFGREVAAVRAHHPAVIAAGEEARLDAEPAAHP